MSRTIPRKKAEDAADQRQRDLITLRLGLPTSSSHALMGGYGGAAVAYARLNALIRKGWAMPRSFIFLPPVIGMIVSLIVRIITNRQEPEAVKSGSLVSPAPTGLRGRLQSWSRHQRRTKRHGHHHCRPLVAAGMLQSLRQPPTMVPPAIAR